MEEPLEALMLALLLLAAVLVSSVIDQLVPKISSPLIQILLGLGIALLASSQIKIELDDKLFLVLFIAPLLYDEAKNIDKASLWRNRKPVLSLRSSWGSPSTGSCRPSACSPLSRWARRSARPMPWR